MDAEVARGRGRVEEEEREAGPAATFITGGGEEEQRLWRGGAAPESPRGGRGVLNADTRPLYCMQDAQPSVIYNKAVSDLRTCH
jgi:hypothetical protein